MIENLTNFFANEANLILTLTIFTAVIVVYSIFAFYFYRILAKKNIVELNLNQYNRSNHPIAVKIFTIIFYILEYIILLPVLTFFWFTVLAILILLLAKEIDVSTILLISSALVASVRATSYVSENLSKDLAKMLPFTLLAIAITTAGFFDIGTLIARISEIPSLLSNLPYYLFFIIGIEFIMRTADFVQSVFQSSEEAEEGTTPTEEKIGTE